MIEVSGRGPEHPDTLISTNNLAWVLDSQGKYIAAEEMHRRTLELRVKVLGLEHPDTLMSRPHSPPAAAPRLCALSLLQNVVW